MSTVPVLDLPLGHPLFSLGSRLLAALPAVDDGGAWYVGLPDSAGSDPAVAEFVVTALVPEPGYPGEFQGVHDMFVAVAPVPEMVAAVRAFYGV